MIDFYINVADLMRKHEILLIPLISVTVPVWSDLNVRY